MPAPAPNRRPWTTGEVARLRALRAAGWALPRIAAALGRSRGSVSGQLVRQGLTAPAPAFRRKPGRLRRALVRLLRRCGVTEAADYLGVSRQCVYRTLARSRKDV